MTTPAEPMDLSGPLRLAILGNAGITALLGLYQGEPAVLTTRPVPDDATYPMVVVSEDISIGDMDGLTSVRPMPRRDLLVYGENPADYRTVEAIGYMLRQQFHRNRMALDLTPGFHVIDVVAQGPLAAPTSDQNLLGRVVMLQLRLEALPP